MAESAAPAETKKFINPRVEIDTSPPFESVKEAVDRFGGSGQWIPHHLLRLAASHHENEALDVDKIEQHAVQLERDLIMKEQQTLNVLKELKSAKRFVEGLKFSFTPEMSSFTTSPDPKLERLCDVLSPALMFTELPQAKLNLNKTSVDLAAIQASVESLNKKLRKDKALLEERNKEALSVQGDHQIPIRKPEESQKIEGVEDDDVSMTLSEEVKQMNFEAEQFKKMTEASRYEVMKAMAEIERMKNCIRMAEMRLNAAKKMEEAAKAVKAIALAEKNSSYHDILQNPNGITLSFEEYQALSSKAKQAEEICKTKFIDTNGLQRDDEMEVLILENFEEKNTKEKLTKSKLSNPNGLNGNESCERREQPAPGFRSTTSIGDVLSRKYVLQDDVMVGRRVENHSERQNVSLSQMLREQSRLILHPSKNRGEGNVEKQYSVQRKKLGFIQVPIPTKNNKKKAQAMNQR